MYKLKLQVQSCTGLLISSLFLYSGRYCCLWCHITKQELAVPRDTRGTKPCRILATLHANFQRCEQAVSNLKNAKDFNNVISDPFFEIPLDQVYNILAVYIHNHVCININGVLSCLKCTYAGCPFGSLH